MPKNKRAEKPLTMHLSIHDYRQFYQQNSAYDTFSDKHITDAILTAVTNFTERHCMQWNYLNKTLLRFGCLILT